MAFVSCSISFGTVQQDSSGFTQRPQSLWKAAPWLPAAVGGRWEWWTGIRVPWSKAELEQCGFVPSKGWKLIPKEILEVSEVPSVLKECRAFQQLAFSAHGTKKQKRCRWESEGRITSQKPNSTVLGDIKAWESSGILILQTPHGDASMQVHSQPQGWEWAALSQLDLLLLEQLWTSSMALLPSTAPASKVCPRSWAGGRVCTPAQLPSSPQGPAPLAAAQGHEQTALRRSSGTSSLCYRFISVWINETVHTIPKKKKKKNLL